MLNLNINSNKVSESAQRLNIDRYTAMARIAAEDMDIKPEEMKTYLDLFHENMANRFGVLESIHQALCGVILNPTFMEGVVKKCLADKPTDNHTMPVQSHQHYQICLN
jgi:hypothetical protein